MFGEFFCFMFRWPALRALRKYVSQNGKENHFFSSFRHFEAPLSVFSNCFAKDRPLELSSWPVIVVVIPLSGTNVQTCAKVNQRAS